MNYNYKIVDERMNLAEVEKLLNGLIRYSLDVIQEDSEEGYYKAIEVLNMAEKITSDYSDFEELVGDEFLFCDLCEDIINYKIQYVERLEEIHHDYLYDLAKLH